jgi:5'-deoxynucleotidase
MNPVKAYLSGSVTRWHQNPAMAHVDQPLADHQGRCVHLLLVLHPSPSAALIRAVATHDGGELDAGDLSYDFKVWNPDLAAAHARFEDGARQAVFGPDPVLSLDEVRWVKLIDQLEAACFVLLRNPAEYHRAASGWLRAEAWLLMTADDLGCGIAVRGLMHDLKGGLW